MGTHTLIQWCDSTVNPVMGCAGCELWTETRKSCYAGQLHANPFFGNKKGFTQNFLSPKTFAGRMIKAAGHKDLHGQDREDKPWLNGLPRILFISDMGDALSERGAIDERNRKIAGGAIPFEFLKTEIIDAVMSVKGQRHQWLWLTKRPHRLKKFVNWINHKYGLSVPRNLWLGTSVTRRSALKRVDDLATIGSKDTIRFVSVEPLWEEVSLADHLEALSWVIVGGESAQGVEPKPFDLQWSRNLKAECQAAKVPYFLKQLGSHVIENGKRLSLKDSHGGDWEEWPSDLRIRQMPVARLA